MYESITRAEPHEMGEESHSVKGIERNEKLSLEHRANAADKQKKSGYVQNNPFEGPCKCRT